MQVLIKKLLCGKCKKRVTYKINKKQDVALINGIDVDYTREYAICDECGEEMYIPGLDDRNENIVEKLFWGKKGIGKVENKLVFSTSIQAVNFESFNYSDPVCDCISKDTIALVPKENVDIPIDTQAIIYKLNQFKETVRLGDNYPYNYIRFICDKDHDQEIIFVGDDPKLRFAMLEVGIDFYTVRPSQELLYDWVGRSYAIGMKSNEIDIIAHNWKNISGSNYDESCGKALILLEAGEFITPALISKIKNKYDKY